MINMNFYCRRYKSLKHNSSCSALYNTIATSVMSSPFRNSLRGLSLAYSARAEEILDRSQVMMPNSCWLCCSYFPPPLSLTMDSKVALIRVACPLHALRISSAMEACQLIATPLVVSTGYWGIPSLFRWPT